MTTPTYFAAMERALDCVRRGAYATALSHFQDALSEDPDSADAHAELSLCLTHLNRRYGALEEAERALRCDPEDPKAHIAHGFALLHGADTAGARRAVVRVQAVDPENLHALYLSCAVALWEREPRRLREAALKLLAQAPWHHDGKWMLSRAESFAGNGREAERLAREALAEQAEDPAAHEALGWAFVTQGKSALASRAALNALALAPDDKGAFALLAAAKLRQRPLTGWMFWGAVWLLKSSERVVLSVVLIGGGIYMLAADFLRHYQLREAHDTLVAAGWVAVIVWVVTVQIMHYILDRETLGVRLDKSF